MWPPNFAVIDVALLCWLLWNAFFSSSITRTPSWRWLTYEETSPILNATWRVRSYLNNWLMAVSDLKDWGIEVWAWWLSGTDEENNNIVVMIGVSHMNCRVRSEPLEDNMCWGLSQFSALIMYFFVFVVVVPNETSMSLREKRRINNSKR